jgi:hypothetical protein
MKQDQIVYQPGLVLYMPLYELDGLSFSAGDAFGHLCSVTGALWTPRGRSFDGVDDKIQAANPVFAGIKDASVMTVFFWVNIANNTGWGNFIGVKSAAGINWLFSRKNATYTLRYEDSGGAYNTNYDFPPAVYTCVTAVIDGPANNIDVYINGNKVQTLYNKNFGTSDGGGVLNLGWDGVSLYGNGTFGEAGIFNRRLSIPEIKKIYLATKWRYQ